MTDKTKTRSQLLTELRQVRQQLASLGEIKTEWVRLLGILDSTTDFVSTATLDGQVTFVNRGGRRLVGWDENENPAGRAIADFHPDWASELVLNEGIPTAVREGVWRGETALLGQGGVEVPVSQIILAHRSPDGEVEFISTVIRDISDRKQAEQERLAHVRVLESLDRINRAIGDTDDLDRMMSDVLDETLTIFSADRAWLLFPCDPESPTWRVPMERTVPEYPSIPVQGIDQPMEPLLAEVMHQLLVSGGLISMTADSADQRITAFAREYRFLSVLSMAIYPKAGPPWMFGLHQCSHPRVWTEEDKRILQQIGLRMADALTSLLTRRDLEESEEKFRGLVERAHGGIVIVRQYLVEYVNPSYARLTGFEPEELVGQTFTSLVDAQDRDEAEDRCRRLMAGAQGPTSFQTRLVRKDGRVIDVECDVGRISHTGDPTILIIVRDVTAEKRAELERLNHVRMLESLDRINRAIGGTDDMDQMMSDVLDAALGIFEADRAWLLFPCDPDAPSWQVPMERTVPEYTSGFLRGDRAPVNPELSEEMRLFKEAGGPLSMVPAGGHYWREELFEQFHIRSMLATAIHPKVGQPWLFGLHQCSHARIWTEEESRIFDQIGRRVADALTTLLTHRDLKESEKKFRELIERARDGIVIVLDRQIEYLNPAHSTLTGYETEELLGKEFTHLVHPQERDKIEDRHRRRMAGEDVPSIYETRLIHKDGRVIDVEFNSGIINYQGRPANLTLVRDITERKRSEEALRDSERRYRELFNSISDFVYTHDLEGRFLAINPVAAESLGYAVDEVLGRNISELIPETERAGFKDGYLKRITDQGRDEGTLVLLARDGTERYLEYNSVLVGTETEKTHVNGAARDVTERVLAKREVRKLEQQLVQAQKMEAIGRLAGGVAHDFNNLLSVINGYSELLIRRLDPADPQVKELEQIHQAGTRAADLTNQLLAFSRRQIIKPRVLDFNRVVAGLEEMLRRLIGEDIALSTILEADLGRVRADPGQLEQVIMNLALNARDAMPGGGVLTIETANVDLDQRYVQTHLEAEGGPHVMLAISDTGQGMDEQTRAQVFEPFFTTKAMGTGLGLATVYGIVKQSGGNIIVYSEAGKGTTFKIYLPRVGEAAETVLGEEEHGTRTDGSETVLLVEDEDLVRDYVAEVLKAKGYRVLEAADGRSALAVLDGHDGTVQLLVTDVVMPGMSGRELAEHVTSLRPGIKVLFMSGYTDNIIVHHGVLDPEANLISKPFSVEALARKVRLVLDG